MGPGRAWWPDERIGLEPADLLWLVEAEAQAAAVRLARFATSLGAVFRDARYIVVPGKIPIAHDFSATSGLVRCCEQAGRNRRSKQQHLMRAPGFSHLDFHTSLDFRYKSVRRFRCLSCVCVFIYPKLSPPQPTPPRTPSNPSAAPTRLARARRGRRGCPSRLAIQKDEEDRTRDGPSLFPLPAPR